MATSPEALTHTYKTVGDLSLTLDVIKPLANKQSNISLIHYHGGFLEDGTKRLILSGQGFEKAGHRVLGEKTTFPPHWLINCCRNRGWTYVSPSYRLLPEATGLEAIEDSLDALAWVRANISERIIVAGSSAGGYLALCAAADITSSQQPQGRKPDIPAVLSIYGVLDPSSPRYVRPGQPLMKQIKTDYSSALEGIQHAMLGSGSRVIDAYAFPADPSTDKRWQWISAIHQEALYPDIMARTPGLANDILHNGITAIPEDCKRLFPATFAIGKSFPPMALLHGGDDDAVNVDQSELVANKLRGVHGKVLLEVVEGQGHGFDVRNCPKDIEVDSTETKEPSFIPQLKNIMRFLDEYVA